MNVNQHMIGFTESKTTNHRFYGEEVLFRKFSPAEPSENYLPKLRSVAVVAAAVGRRHLGKPASPAKKFFRKFS